MRAVAVVAVLVFHVGALPAGYLGVDVFFVLSGFLITSLLITEWDANGGRIGFRDFYARRALRLFPALACVIVAAAVLAAILLVVAGRGAHAGAVATFTGIGWVAAFAGNWVLALTSSQRTLGALGHTWSLAVEEQFYLLWPWLLALLMRRGYRRDRLALWIALLAVADMAYRAVMAGVGYGHDRIYYATDTHCDGLLLGCALAFWLAARRPVPALSAPRQFWRVATWLAAATLVIVFVVGNLMGTLATSIAVLASGVILVGVVTGDVPAPIQRLLSSGLAVRIGRRSYGLYLWQYVILFAVIATVKPYIGLFRGGSDVWRLVFAMALVGVVAASFAAAELSYRFIELPALRRKRRFYGSKGQ
jgi:peptidoglycan/LPS O-acetylase OafA/YrhL